MAISRSAADPTIGQCEGVRSSSRQVVRCPRYDSLGIPGNETVCRLRRDELTTRGSRAQNERRHEARRDHPCGLRLFASLSYCVFSSRRRSSRRPLEGVHHEASGLLEERVGKRDGGHVLRALGLTRNTTASPSPRPRRASVGEAEARLLLDVLAGVRWRGVHDRVRRHGPIERVHDR